MLARNTMTATNHWLERARLTTPSHTVLSE